MFGGGNNPSGEPESSMDRHESRADLAAQHELNALADRREAEAEEDYEDVAARTEADRQGQSVKRRFGVKFTRLSGRVPAITSYFSRNSRNARRDNDNETKESTETLTNQPDMPKQPAAQPATASGQPEPSQQQPVASQDSNGCAPPGPGSMQFSSTPILPQSSFAPEQPAPEQIQSGPEQSTPGLSTAAHIFGT